MRRSRLTGQTKYKAKDTGFDWFFAGEPMDKRSSRSGRIRLVRYVPETETCIHSQCPSPSALRETVICTCGNRRELHSANTRSSSPTPTSRLSPDFEPALRCKSCGGFHALKRDSSPQAEKPICSCNRFEFHTREPRPRSPTNSVSMDYGNHRGCSCDNCRAVERRRLRATSTRPTTPSSGDSSDYEQSRSFRRHHRRTPARTPETFSVTERYCEIHTRPTTSAASTKFNTPLASCTTGRTTPLVRCHCPQAMYCEDHPELCRAVPSPAPNPDRAKSRQSSAKSRHSSRDKSTQRQPKCTCGVPCLSENAPSKPGSAKTRTGVQYCTCPYRERGFVDDSEYFDSVDDDISSESSMYAMPADDREDLESHCALYHRCRPRYERGNGWVCGRR